MAGKNHKFKEGSEPYEKFLPFVGDNHHRVPMCTHQWGGGVNIKNHVGKPLSEWLWKDLHERHHMTSCNIVPHGSSEWTLGHGAGHVTIYLDENDCLESASIYPHGGWRRDYQPKAEDMPQAARITKTDSGLYVFKEK